MGYEVLLAPELLGLWPRPRHMPDEESLTGQARELHGEGGRARCTTGLGLHEAVSVSAAFSVLFWLRPSPGCRPRPVTESHAGGIPEVIIRLGHVNIAVDPCAATVAVSAAGNLW